MYFTGLALYASSMSSVVGYLGVQESPTANSRLPPRPLMLLCADMLLLEANQVGARFFRDLSFHSLMRGRKLCTELLL